MKFAVAALMKRGSDKDRARLRGLQFGEQPSLYSCRTAELLSSVAKASSLSA